MLGRYNNRKLFAFSEISLDLFAEIRVYKLYLQTVKHSIIISCHAKGELVNGESTLSHVDK